MNLKSNVQLQPRLIRLRDAAIYLGMDKNRFNSEVRPSITEIPIGQQGIAFDRLDLDEWVVQYKKCNGRPGITHLGDKLWDAEKHPGSVNVVKGSGISKNRSSESSFAKALAQATSKKQS